MNVKVDDFVDKCILDLAKDGCILDIGGATPYQKMLKKYKGKIDLKTLDYDPNTHPDIVGDAHDLPFEDGTVDGIICIATLEHLQNPFKAVSEAYRVLKTGGKVLYYIPFLHPFHGNERFSDYFRFTYQGCELMFYPFINVEIVANGGINNVIEKMLPKKIRPLRYLAYPFTYLFTHMTKTGKSTTPGYFIFAEK